MAVKPKDMLSPLMVTNLQRLGTYLKQARKRRGWSVEKVRGDICCSKGTLEQAERGEPTVNIAVYLLLLDLYGMDCDLSVLAAPEKDSLGMAIAESRLSRKPKQAAATKIDAADF